MQHFANFQKPILTAMGVLNGAKIGGAVGLVDGLARGTGIDESQEERDKTTLLGRAGKLLTRTAGGTAVGALAGGTVGGVAGAGYGYLRRNNQNFDAWARKSKLPSQQDMMDKVYPT
jgi:hypothetical protein